METTINHGAVALQDVTVTYSVEEAIRLVHTFDNMLNAIVCAVSEGEEDKKLLDDALTANIFIVSCLEKLTAYFIPQKEFLKIQMKPMKP